MALIMEQLYIPKERLKLLKDNPAILKAVIQACKTKISIIDDEAIEINGGAFEEFTSKNVLFAYGRGFDIKIALLLNSQDYYFKVVDIKLIERNKQRIRQIKSRIIGEGGRTKRYVEQVSGAHISIYGDSVAIIGKIDSLYEAETAINTIIEGGTHRLAYLKMEAAHRKNRNAATSARF